MKVIYLFLLLSFLFGTANSQDVKESISTKEVQAKSTKTIKEFYTLYATKIASNKSIEAIESSVNSLKRQYMTPELIEKLARIRTATGTDPVIRTQDFNEKAIGTLDVKCLEENWYMVSYSSGESEKKQVTIPLRITPAGGRYRIDYITPIWNGSIHGNSLLCDKPVSRVVDTSSPLSLLKTFYDAYLTEYCNMPANLESRLKSLRDKYCTKEALKQFRTAADTHKADGEMGYDLLIDYFDFDCLWRSLANFTAIGEDMYQFSYNNGGTHKPYAIHLKIIKRGKAYYIDGISSVHGYQTVHSQAQDVSGKIHEREVEYNAQYAKYWYNDVICDTLFLEDGTSVFFLRTPIRHIQGYTTLFKTDKNIYNSESLFLTHSGLGYKGYKINWKIKNRKLYVAQVVWNPIERYDRDKNGIIAPWQGKNVSPDEIKKRFENLTGRKFDEDGLMLADWVTDAIRVTKYHPYHPYIKDICPSRGFLYAKQKTFELEFMKGVLRKVNAIMEIGKNEWDLFQEH